MYVIAFDFEAPGGIPHKNAFTQLGAVLFNMSTGKVEDTFNEYSCINGYTWDENCVKEFWSKFPERFEETKQKCSESLLTPYEVVDKFITWCQTHSRNVGNDLYLITDCSTFDSGILKCFSNTDTLYILDKKKRDIVDVGAIYLGLSRKYNSTEFIDGSAFKSCIKNLNITEEFISSKFHDHHPVNDATVIAEKWHFINKFL